MKCLTTKLLFLQKKKINFLPLLFQYKENFDAYRVTCKAKYLKINENEISMLKIKINDLKMF